jgi:hypothetical protein
MRCCLYQVGEGSQPRLGLLRDDDQYVVDVHRACVTSLSGHMTPKRASEIAMALCPPELLAFLENGRHAWNALSDSLERLGHDLEDLDLEAPDGEPVVRPVDSVRIRPVVGWGVRTGEASTPRGSWRTVNVPLAEGRAPFDLHTDGRAYLPEYLVVIGHVADAIGDDEAWDHVALVTETRPTDPIDAAVLRTPDELGAEDDVLRNAVAAAVSDASRSATLYTGDVVRTGLALIASVVDLTEGATIDLDRESSHPAELT